MATLFSAELQRVGFNAAWLVWNRLFRMAVGVVVLGVVGRYLGPAGFGVLNYAIGLTAVFAAVAGLGLDGIVIRELVKAPERTAVILGSAFVLRLGGALLALGLVALASLPSQNARDALSLTLIVGLGFLPGAVETIDLWFQSNLQAKHTVLARAVAVLVGAGLRIGLVLGGASLAPFAWAMVADAAVGGLALVVTYRSRGRSVFDWRFSARAATDLLRDSWPLSLSGVLIAVYMRIEQLLVMNLLGSHTMGIYYAAARLTDVWTFVPPLLLASLYPVLVQRRQGDPSRYREHLQAVYDLLTGLGLLVAAGGTLVAPYAIRLIFGHKYEEAIPILVIMAWSAPVIFSGTVRAQHFLLENLTLYHTWSALIGLVANGLAGYLLMPHLGAKGAAVGALLANVLSAYLTSFIFPRLRECAVAQTRAFLVPFRLRPLLRQFRRQP